MAGSQYSQSFIEIDLKNPVIDIDAEIALYISIFLYLSSIWDINSISFVLIFNTDIINVFFVFSYNY